MEPGEGDHGEEGSGEVPSDDVAYSDMADGAQLSRKLDAAIAEAVQECRRIGYNPAYFVEMLHRHGGIETARRLITTRAASDGFTKLWELGRLDLSVEAVALRPELAPLFTRDELDAARRRLDDYGHSAGSAGAHR